MSKGCWECSVDPIFCGSMYDKRQERGKNDLKRKVLKENGKMLAQYNLVRLMTGN